MMMEKVKDLLVLYQDKILTNSEFSVSQQIGTIQDLPRTDTVYMQMLKHTYILITTCEKTAMAKSGIQILLEVKKYHKRNNDFGFQTTLSVFSTCLYIIQLYLVRILRHPWKRDFWKIKTYNGAFKHVISENLAPSIYKELMQGIGYYLSQDRKHFEMKKVMSKDTRSEFELLALDLFLAHGYCRMQGEPTLLLELQGKRPNSEPNVGNPKHTTSKKPPNSFPNNTPREQPINAKTNALRASEASYSSLPSSYQEPSRRNVPGSSTRRGSFNDRPSTSSNLHQESVIIDSSYRDRPTSSGYQHGSVIIGQYSEPPRKNDETIRNSNRIKDRRQYQQQNSLEDCDEIIESSDKDSLKGKIYYPPRLHDLETPCEVRGKPDGSIEETEPIDPYDFNNTTNTDRYHNDRQVWPQMHRR